MSININVVSDKPEFTNFFSEQIVLPSNCEATMVKANLDIPLLQMVAVKVPTIPLADRGREAIQVIVDGIIVNITWTDLYNAHTDLAATDIDAGVTANEYFSGNYEYIPNNNIYSIDPATNEPTTKLHFPSVLTEAMRDVFQFYDFRVEIIKEPTAPENVFTNILSGMVSRNYTSTDAYIEPYICKGYRINAVYTPQKLLDNPLVIENIDAASLIGWTQSLAAVENVGGTVCQAWFNDDGIDLNGGWYEFRATTLVGGRMATGFVFEGTGLGAAGDNYQPTAVYEPQVIDVGIEFETDAAGVGLYRIINGQEQYVYYDNTLLKEVVTTKPIYEPANAKHIFQDTDNFYLQIQRGNLYNGSNEFIVNIYQGQTGTGITDGNVRKIFTSSHNLRSPAIIPNIGFMDNGTLGDKFTAIKYIERTLQTDTQAQWQGASASAQFTGVFQLDPYVRQDTGGQENRNFWSAWGMPTDDISSVGGSAYTSIDSINQSLIFQKNVKFTGVNSKYTFYLGQTVNNEIFTLSANNTLSVNTNSTNALQNLPKELKVAINNLPVKSFQGQYNTTANYAVSSGGEQRVIGTIPLPLIDVTDTNIPITYEPYNLTYKPFNNPEPFMFNQLLMEIFYQDFDTNRRLKFSTVNGHLTLDLNLRQGAKPPAVANNIRAI